MKTIFAKAAWEAYQWPMDHFITKVAEAGWTATEIYLADRPESRLEILRLHRQAGLDLIAQIVTYGATPTEHLASLRRGYQHALECEPIAVNCHTGRDIFSFAENRMLFEAAAELAAREGVPLLHEIHRGRALFTAPVCREYLEAVPAIRLTADFSHLFCVHESDLSDQPAAVEAIVAASDHIHARIGFAEGPQVSDPRHPDYQEWVGTSIALWDRIRTRQVNEGKAWMTVTPEFGPPPYAPLQSGSSQPVTDPWEVNHWMREKLTDLWSK